MSQKIKWVEVGNTHKVLPGFNPSKPVLIIELKTGKRFLLKELLRQWVDNVWCTNARHHGPMFNDKGMETYSSNSKYIAVNYH